MATFEFCVMDPEEKQGSGALDRPFWVYHVRCRTTMERYPRKELEVVRRYSDFDWFRQRLAEEFQWCIIPPIPDKDIQGSVAKFVTHAHNPNLIVYRQRALRKFLVRLGHHPVLQQSLLLQQFLEMEPIEWERNMKKPAQKVSVEGTLSSLVNAVSSQWTPPPMPGAPGKSYDKVITAVELPSNPQVWEETKHYVSQLEESIKTLKERLDILVRRRKSTGTCLSEFGRSFQTVGQVEAQLERQDTSLSHAVVAVGRHSQELATIYTEHADQETKQVVEILIYYVGMCESVKETLKRLQACIAHRDSVVKAEKDAIQKRDAAVGKGPADKVEKLNVEVAAAAQKRDEAVKGVRRFEEMFREELRRFHQDKQYDMKTLLKSFVDLQLDYAGKMKRSWEGLLPMVEEVKL